MSKTTKYSYTKDLLLLSLTKFYSNKDNIAEISPIILGKSPLSLRLLDWFVTNYSKKNNTIMSTIVDNNVLHFNVYLSYRSQLKAYSKHHFDPFRRRDRIDFYYDKNNFIETTIGQLNFFRWTIQNNILEYIKENIKEIESDMVSIHKKPNDGKKRLELSKSVIKNMNTFVGSHTISFN